MKITNNACEGRERERAQLSRHMYEYDATGWCQKWCWRKCYTRVTAVVPRMRCSDHRRAVGAGSGVTVNASARSVLSTTPT